MLDIIAGLVASKWGTRRWQWPTCSCSSSSSWAAASAEEADGRTDGRTDRRLLLRKLFTWALSNAAIFSASLAVSCISVGPQCRPIRDSIHFPNRFFVIRFVMRKIGISIRWCLVLYTDLRSCLRSTDNALFHRLVNSRSVLGLLTITTKHLSPVSTSRVDGPSWRVTGFHYPSTRAVLTGARFH